jgi:hypothetical protein
MARHDERVAAVVPGAREDDDALPAAAGKLACKLRCSESRALHELRRVGL